jgi:hypothetical protein
MVCTRTHRLEVDLLTPYETFKTTQNQELELVLSNTQEVELGLIRWKMLDFHSIWTPFQLKIQSHSLRLLTLTDYKFMRHSDSVKCYPPLTSTSKLLPKPTMRALDF